MYTIKMDGKVLYSPAMAGTAHKVLNPKLALDINANGSCTFMLPPGNSLYHDIRKRKSVVTVHQDGEEIFRCRVLDDEKDTYNQKDVYCEGVRSYLNDSQAAPYTYSGKVRGLLSKLIDEHNLQVEEEKRFTVGVVTAVDEETVTGKIENVAYWESFREIEEKLLGAYGGYLRARYEGGVLYIDWLKEYSSADSKEIRFGVNLLDLMDKGDTGDVFTILRPLGAAKIGEDGEYGDPVTIASVNGGLDYIVDEEAVTKYGKIWRTHTWPNEESPARLLEKGHAYMQIGAELRTITLKAIDMHFISGSADAIRVGDKVHIISQPHGIDLTMVCCKIEIDLVNPENTTYTFGEPPRTLTDNTVKAERESNSLTGRGGGGRGSMQQQLDGIVRWADFKVDQANARITANAGEINTLNGVMSQAWIEIEGMHAQIRLKASQEEVTDLGMRMSKAGIDIRGDIASIKLLATQETVDDLGSDLDEAWIEINGAKSQITLKADQVDLDALITKVNGLMAGGVKAEALHTKKLIVTNDYFHLGLHDATWKDATVISGGSCSIESTKKTVVDANDNPIGYVYVPTKVTFSPSGKKTIQYVGGSW